MINIRIYDQNYRFLVDTLINSFTLTCLLKFLTPFSLENNIGINLYELSKQDIKIATLQNNLINHKCLLGDDPQNECKFNDLLTEMYLKIKEDPNNSKYMIKLKF